MSDIHYISSQPLTLGEVETILRERHTLALSPEAEKKIADCHAFLHAKLEASEAPIYGVNTGFGALFYKQISAEDLEQLQRNLVMSHACGTGPEVPEEIVRLMLLLKIQSLAYGHSGVQVRTVKRLLDFYNREVYPVVYEQGSLGASGDLAPLAHLALPLLGLGEVRFQGYRLQSADVLSIFSWDPIQLQAKEGLALLNGTQFMAAYGLHCLLKARRLMEQADVIGALSLDAFLCRTEAFAPMLHRIRPHRGQVRTAARISQLLEGSQMDPVGRKHVQDPYSFRCIPQVHGASRDAIDYVMEVFETELNSVTDNPNIFPEEDSILSGGNFHGQTLALALDFLCLALAELGSISERRIFQLMGGLRGLPEFLIKEPGLHSGFMIPQYTAAGIVSQNKQLCTPASVDSITSSNGQEDHVSMGANAATKTLLVVENLERILAIELFSAAQAMEFRKPHLTSPPLNSLLKAYRIHVSFVDWDRPLYLDIQKTVGFLQTAIFV
ncbi:histidine ammonia-lyase [soil metagenome]